ncbi:SDR family oxidoreductase [Alteromonas sp. a30]|uniref:SDR family oxidoreductase n=1 Tax=Alteromonas sp. a30 TaxID=2730917 RepID=UPI0022829C25|nr:SDR family oxidoreductase [Alteromonas sp. a30]MCY7295536.1 SDR family oxidoreductase [Alteromonas sp. a30]
MQWNQQICFLTGASGGIGQAIAHALVNKGAKLILNGRNESQLRALCAKLPGTHEYLAADLSDKAQREMVIAELNARDDVTMLINNAGVAGFNPIENVTGDNLETLLNINLNSPIQLIQGVLPSLKRRDKASIINVGSTFGSIGFPCFSTYCASKFGLRGFTEALQRELADSSVNVLYLAPRTTSTSINSATVDEMNQALGNQVDSPDVVAQALIQQLESGKLRVFVGWPEKLFVKINGAFPNLVDNALLKKLPIIKKFASKIPLEANS